MPVPASAKPPPAPAAPSGVRARILADILAGLSVALVLIPQSLAYAELAGLPAYVGLYASALAPIAAAFFASSAYLQTGPTAVTSLLTLAALAPFAAHADVHLVALAGLLALVVGVLRVGLGLLRAGALTFFLSPPVLQGFTFGAALLIAASQLPILLGTSPPAGGVLARAAAALATPTTWSPEALLVGAATLVVIIGGRRLHALFPGVLIAVAAGVALGIAGVYHDATVGPVPEGFIALELDLPWDQLGALLVPGFVIAVLGFAEPTAIARSFATAERKPWDANRELISQGVANLASGLTRGFPVGGSFARSALSHLAGTRTRLSGFVTGLVVLAFLPFASVLATLPKAVLAAIILVAITSLLASAADLVRLFRYSVPQAIIAWSTVAFTLALSPHVERAVLVGLGLSFAIHAWREMRVRVDATVEGATLTLSPRGVLWFASAEGLHEAIVASLARHPLAAAVVIDLSGLGRIDYTGARALADMVRETRANGLGADLRGAPPHAWRILGRVCPDLFEPPPSGP